MPKARALRDDVRLVNVRSRCEERSRRDRAICYHMLVTLSVRVCYVPVLGSTVELAHDLRCSGQPMIPYYNVVWPPGRVAIVNIDHNIGYIQQPCRRAP